MKKTKKKLPKDSTLDSLFSQLVRRLAGYKCERCGSTYQYGVSHYHRRDVYSARWDLDNVAWLCNLCHNHTFHLHPDLHTAWFKKRLESEKFEQLSARAMLLAREIGLDREKIKVELKARLKIIEGK